MLLNQHQIRVLDQSTFALAAHKPMNSQLSKVKPPMPPRFPSRNYPSRQGPGFSPRPQFPQYSRGPQQLNRRSS